MKRLYSHDTPAGVFYICFAADVYFAMLGSNLVGSYPSAESAARELAESRHLTLPEEVAFDDLAIPAELDEWRRL